MTVHKQQGRGTQVPESGLPIVLDLPGLAGGEWKDADLLHYVCGVIDDHAQLLPRITSAIKDEYWLVRFHELHWIAKTVRAQQSAGAVDFACKAIAGIAALRRLDTAAVLSYICDALHEERAVIAAQTARLERVARLKWAETLMIAEAVSARGMMATELEDLKHGQRSRLHQRAWDCRIELARAELRVALKPN